jgi:hypothetical protein
MLRTAFETTITVFRQFKTLGRREETAALDSSMPVLIFGRVNTPILRNTEEFPVEHEGF